MSKRIAIALGLVVCAALLVYAILLSSPNREPEIGKTAESMPSETAVGSPGDAGQAEPSLPAPDGRGDVHPHAPNAAAFRDMFGAAGMPASGDAALDPADSEPGFNSMPSLEELRNSAANAGPGPSQIDLGLPGPVMEVQSESVASGEPGKPVASDEPADLDSAEDDAAASGPSQVDLGFPGPAESAPSGSR